MEAWLRNLAEWLKRHPRTFAIGSVIVLIPAGLATLEGIWSLFSDEPLFPYIAERFPWWAFIIFGFIFVFCIVLIVKVYSLIKKPPHIEI